MITYNTNGEEVEIPSLDVDDKEYQKVDTLEDFGRLAEAMGWADSQAWFADTGVDGSELLGKYWIVVHNRVFMRDE